MARARPPQTDIRLPFSMLVHAEADALKRLARWLGLDVPIETSLRARTLMARRIARALERDDGAPSSREDDGGTAR